MKENLLDALMYLFENYMNSDNHTIDPPANVLPEMVQAGFHLQDVDQALNWLSDLKYVMDQLKDKPQYSSVPAHRIFTAEEMVQLPQATRSYLFGLEQVGIINAEVRELIIDRAMALTNMEIDITDIKWITLMVLFNKPELKTKLEFMEDIILSDNIGTRH